MIVALLDLEGDRALARVSQIAPDPAADPIGWFLWAAARLPSGPVDDETRRILSRYVSYALQRTDRLGLLTLCVSFMSSRGLDREGAACRRWLAKVREVGSL